MQGLLDQAHVIAGAIDRLIVVPPIRSRMARFIDVAPGPSCAIDAAGHERHDRLDDVGLAESHVRSLGPDGIDFLTRHVGQFYLSEAPMAPERTCHLCVEFFVDAERFPEDAIWMRLLYARHAGGVTLFGHDVVETFVRDTCLVDFRRAVTGFSVRHASFARQESWA